VATHAINPWLFSRLPYDPIKDFAPITLIAHVPNVLVMTPERAQQLNIRSARDLVAYARANPGKLNYASGGNGSAGHMAGELLKSLAGVSAVHIPYAGAAPGPAGAARRPDRFHVRQPRLGARSHEGRQAAAPSQ
jgi:tripartite-type tricarboxylate transporter receptor subunit TctC